MSTSYDLLEQQWLPVLKGPHTTLVGLREFLHNAHEFDDLAVPVPPAASGLWRILYAITARVTRLDIADGWEDRQEEWMQRGEFDRSSVDAYLGQYRERFDLFHPDRPWLQDPRLRTQCTKTSGVNKLVFDRPSGQNQVWFGHYTDTDPVPLPAYEAAWYLVAQLYYGAAGRCTSREVRGQAFANTSAGPLRSVMSYHPVGRNLFESLILGVPARLAENEAADLCPWERHELPDPLGPPEPTTWPGGLLTGQANHAVLLVSAADGETVADAYVTWARRKTIPHTQDPYVVLRVNSQGDWNSLRADRSRALWRDVDALLADDPNGSYRPKIINTAAALDEGDQRIRAYGFDQDGQAKDHQWFTAITPPILRWRLEQDRAAALGIGALHKAAEQVADRLKTVVRLAWQEVARGKDKNDRIGPWVRPATAHYWAAAERAFWSLVYAESFDDPRRPFLRLGHESIDHATDYVGQRPRVARAVATAHRRLSGERIGAQKGRKS